MLVTSVITKLHKRVVWHFTFNLYMRVSGMLVSTVTIKLHDRIV